MNCLTKFVGLGNLVAAAICVVSQL